MKSELYKTVGGAETVLGTPATKIMERNKTFSKESPARLLMSRSSSVCLKQHDDATQLATVVRRQGMGRGRRRRRRGGEEEARGNK